MSQIVLDLTSFLSDNDAAVQQNSLFGLAPPQEKVYNPHIQACLDAVTEHQRLKALIKGEWVKGLLPQSSVRADYTAQRIRGRDSTGLYCLLQCQ